MDNVLAFLESEFYGYMEGSDGDDVPELMEPIVKSLEHKGYRVKYSSPGYQNTKFKNDRNKDNVINGKYVSTARLIFEKDYKFETTPQGWEWKVLHDNTKALYVKPYTYNKDSHGKDAEEAFVKWQIFYLDNLKQWVKDLPEQGKENEDEDKEDINFSAS